MYSFRRFNYCIVFTAFFVFQFNRIVFLATVRAMSMGLVFWVVELIVDMSPSRQMAFKNYNKKICTMSSEKSTVYPPNDFYSNIEPTLIHYLNTENMPKSWLIAQHSDLVWLLLQ